jgi:chromosome segregation ATPase
MLKKTLLSGAGAMLLAGFLFGTDTVSYLTTSAGWVRDSVKESVPLEFEIERARNLVKELTSDVEKNMGTIATEEVQVERVKKQIQQLQETLSNDRLGILRLQSELSTDKQVFEFGGKTFSKEQVKSDLANRFEQFKTNEATLTSLNDIRQAREKGLAAAQEKLQGMLAAKRKAEVDIQNCQARLQMLQAAQTTSAVTVDDSRLSRAKNLISDVQTRLDVAAKRLAAGSEIRSEIKLDDPATENIEDKVADYFNLPGSKTSQNVATR